MSAGVSAELEQDAAFCPLPWRGEFDGRACETEIRTRRGWKVGDGTFDIALKPSQLIGPVCGGMCTFACVVPGPLSPQTAYHEVKQ